MESCERCPRCRKSIVRRSDDDLRETRRSERISERSKVPSPSTRKHAPGCPESRMILDEEKQHEIASCVDKFALAKRLHAENLQHQPLPDRVDDSIFKKGYRSCSAGDVERRDRDDFAATGSETESPPFWPALGCKKPKTRMDLAICWETPIDPVYEPRRATHIDGSEGGMAPAIFALIRHTPPPRNRELLSRDDGKGEGCDCARVQETREKNPRDRCCCDPSSNGRELVAGSRDKLPRSGRSTRSNSLPRITERKCAACRGGEPETESERRRRRSRDDPRLIRSAVGVALGLEQRCRATTADDGARRNGLPPAKVTVPRPRTPFARRSFCIDTLAPPFSVVNGCRDADYPEHWRLMSVYQQSYRNPQKRRTRRF